MFWRFGFNNSALDGLLDKADVTLQEVFEEEDLIQELKSVNSKLIDFLSKPEIIKSLLEYIIAKDLKEPQKFKYPFLASEIIACEIQTIIDTIVIGQREEMLVPFWSYLSRPAQLKRSALDTSKEEREGLDSLQASHFCKTIGVLLSKYPVEMMDFIRSDPVNLKRILDHLQTSAIMDLLLTLIRMEELKEGKGTVKWLSDHGLIDSLMDRLDPNLDSEEHLIAQQCICEIIRMSQTSLPDSPSIGLNALITDLKSVRNMERLAKLMLDTEAPNATSTLVNGVSILVDLIRHNNADLENDPAITGLHGYSTNMGQRGIVVSLEDMMKVMSDHIPDFTRLLLKPRYMNGTIQTTLGEIEPLGIERLKICELFAELLHCSNMTNMNRTKEKGLSAGDYLKSKFITSKTMVICVELFFGFPWNNFLHYVIYDMLHQVFNGKMETGLNRELTISILKEGEFTNKIIKAQKINDEECAKPKGMRAGYMGHLTFISDEIIKLFEGYPETIVLEIKDKVDMDSWTEYCNRELKETKDRDQLPLGGLRLSEEENYREEEDGQWLSNSNEEHDWTIKGEMVQGMDDLDLDKESTEHAT